MNTNKKGPCRNRCRKKITLKLMKIHYPITRDRVETHPDFKSKSYDLLKKKPTGKIRPVPGNCK